MGRRGFEPLKHRCNRFQVPSSYLEAWTISSPWLLYIENIITLAGRRFVSAPARITRKKNWAHLGAWLRFARHKTLAGFPEFTYFSTMHYCMALRLHSLSPLAAWVPAHKKLYSFTQFLITFSNFLSLYLICTKP